MKFLEDIVTELLHKHNNLENLKIILPGKRPVIFFKKILKSKNYQGLLPEFISIDELLKSLTNYVEIKGIALWIFALKVYQELDSSEDFASFLKWFPTLQKDWDDMMKFTENEQKILDWMLDEERIKNWGENLGDNDNPRKRNLNFWKKMHQFLPNLNKKLESQNWATSGMIYKKAYSKIENFAEQTNHHYVFCGFNALTRVEEKLVKSLLKWDKAECFFQADSYYINDQRQESGKFLRETLKWKEFNNSRIFNWVEDEFSKPKNIKTYEVSGNIVQAKILPQILETIPIDEETETAIILLDENLLPAVLESLGNRKVNITMGFPLKNLSFSNAIKKLFYLQKQLEKKSSNYYYADILPILEEIPSNSDDKNIIRTFVSKIEERNIVYISKKLVEEMLSGLSFYPLLEKPKSAEEFLNKMINFCFQLKFQELEIIENENIFLFEKTLRIIKNQLSEHQLGLKIEVLENLISHLINSENIDFVGEPLSGIQLMGLLESRLLNFKNVILLSVNEGKLPLGNTQNTYLPFDVRNNFGLNTFLENDSIYAYHFYRLLQQAENVHLLFNALSSGVNTGEKSRFITQLEMESNHIIENIIIENTSEPIVQNLMKIEKTNDVINILEEWKKRISASHLVTYLYNPIDFYLNQVLKTRETNEIEEEISQRNYGNLVHYSLQYLLEKIKGKILSEKDLEFLIQNIDEAINYAIEELKHQPEFYERGMNYIHKEIAKRVVFDIINFDLNLVKEGNVLEIIDLERNVENEFLLDKATGETITFYGFIDRIDRLNGSIRIIDYKTAKPKNLKLDLSKNKEEKLPVIFFNDANKQALQLAIYKFCVKQIFQNSDPEMAIWSFAEAQNGPSYLQINDATDDEIEDSIRLLIQEILNPEIPFEEKEKASW